jgi:hypothetical protein
MPHIRDAIVLVTCLLDHAAAVLRAVAGPDDKVASVTVRPRPGGAFIVEVQSDHDILHSIRPDDLAKP